MQAPFHAASVPAKRDTRQWNQQATEANRASPATVSLSRERTVISGLKITETIAVAKLPIPHSDVSTSKQTIEDYLELTLGRACGTTKTELRARIQSHLIPYDAIGSQGDILDRYEGLTRQHLAFVARSISEWCNL